MKEQAIHEKRSFASVKELIEFAEAEYKGRCAFAYKPDPRKREITEISFSRFTRDVKYLTCLMKNMDIKGRHIALVGKLSYHWALVYYAVIISGGVLVPLDRDWTGEEIGATAAFADCEYMFIDGDIKEKANEIKDMKGCYVINGRGDMEELLQKGRALYKELPHLWSFGVTDAEKTALIVFTSGTTGKGKGVMLSQRAVLEDITSVVPYIDFSSNTVGVLPPHHTYGSTVMLLGHTAIGSRVYISSGLRYITKELMEERPGHLILVPLYLETFYRRIHAAAKEKGREKTLYKMIAISNALRKIGIDIRYRLFSSVTSAFGGRLKTVICGGAPINQDMIDFFDSVGITVLNGYGITECAPIVAVNRSRNIIKGSVGNVLDVNRVKIDRPDANREGEILVKGANVMQGYYKNEGATREALTADGYFRTGDYGRLEKGEVLYITGRKKNLIILSNGKNVYPEEIENELISVPGVLEIVCYEGKSKRGPEHNGIAVEIFPDGEFLKNNGIEDKEGYFRPYIDAYNKRAQVYKRVDVFKLRDTEFPKNTLKKIMRFKIDTTVE